MSFEQLGGSGLNCLDSVFAELRSNGYAHHIQRLMVLANYGLIAGLNPQALTAWFHRMFIDGHDWVMQTNVIGMGVFRRLARGLADAGGTLIYTTQMVDLAADFSDHVCVLRQGRVALWETSARVREMIAAAPEGQENVLRGLR